MCSPSALPRGISSEGGRAEEKRLKHSGKIKINYFVLDFCLLILNCAGDALPSGSICSLLL